MTSYTSLEDLEAHVPLSQLIPSVAFSRCARASATQLPKDVDKQTGEQLVQSLEMALTVHRKAQVVLQCWVLLIMRRQFDKMRQKDEQYSRLQGPPVSYSDKLRYRRGAMLLCHLLIERNKTQENSLLDRYLADPYFSWSSAITITDKYDSFYLHDGVIVWVQKAWDHLRENNSKITAKEWLNLRLSSSSGPPPPSAPAALIENLLPSAPAPLITDSPPSAPAALIDDRKHVDPLTNSSAEPTSPPRYTRSKDSSLSRSFHSTQSSSTAQTRIVRQKKRQRTEWVEESVTSACEELETLRTSVEVWAKRLHRQLLQAIDENSIEQIRQIADLLQKPPLRGEEDEEEDNAELDGEGTADEEKPVDGSSDDDGGISGEDSDENILLRRDTDDSDGSLSQSQMEELECTICAEKRVKEVWTSKACTHGSCGQCMLDRLASRARRCLTCSTGIVELKDKSGKAFKYYEWLNFWKEQQKQEEIKGRKEKLK